MVHRTGHPLAADKALAFELVSCSLPVANLRHEYTLTDTTGPAGRALDVVVMRRQWNRGTKGFLHGLQQYVQPQHDVTTR